MDWIKKNLGLVISGVVALVLLGLAGYYLYSKYTLSTTHSAQLEEQESKLQGLINLRPNPGRGKVDNIAAAREQEQRLREFAEKARSLFVNVPYPTNLDSGSFRLLLDETLEDLQRTARNSGTKLPDNFAFTFSVQKSLAAIKASTIVPLARTLKEVQAIAEVLFDAKVIEVDRIRRVSVPDEDTPVSMMIGGSTEYWTRKPTTNELAIVMPYEFTFRCFSSELQPVLEGLARSPHNFLVKNLTIDTGETNTFDMYDPNAGGGGDMNMPRMDPRMMMMMRYGMRPGMGRMMMPPPTDLTDPSQAPTDPTRIVGEKPFRVTAWIDVVRLRSPEEAPAGRGGRPVRGPGAVPGEAPGDATGDDPTAANGTAGTN